MLALAFSISHALKVAIKIILASCKDEHVAAVENLEHQRGVATLQQFAMVSFFLIVILQYFKASSYISDYLNNSLRSSYADFLTLI